jgi:hypothetical protein
LGFAGLFLLTSKAQHAPLGLWIGVFFCVVGHRKARWFAAVITATALLWLWKSTPQEYAEFGCFSTVFYRILPNSADANQTLSDLGLNQNYERYIGMVAYSSGSPMGDPRFVAAFRRHVTYGSLAIYLLTHPRDAYVALRVSLDEAGRLRPLLGNFDPSAGFAPYAESRSFACWSDFKRALFENRGLWFMTCFLGVAVINSILLFAQRRRLPAGGVAAGLILIGMALTELAVASLADAMEVARHFLLFYALFDMLVIAGVWLAARMLTERQIHKASPRPLPTLVPQPYVVN